MSDRRAGSPASSLLPDGFTFSQSSLQDFSDCRRRFELRYLLQVAWPALESEPVLESERSMRRGAHFHRLAHQRLLGLPAESLERQAGDEQLHRWWRSFQGHGGLLAQIQAARGRLLPEISLSAGLEGYRLQARYDLLAIGADGHFSIYDWKTSLRRPRRAVLAARLQTRVYPYLLALAGAGLNGGDPPPPEKIEMVYWFAEFPDQPERFPYSAGQFEHDEATLVQIVSEITRLVTLPPARLPGQVGAFALTSDPERCAFCIYRSLCGRGERAGDLVDLDDDPLDGPAKAFYLDFDALPEVDDGNF